MLVEGKGAVVDVIVGRVVYANGTHLEGLGALGHPRIARGNKIELPAKHAGRSHRLVIALRAGVPIKPPMLAPGRLVEPTTGILKDALFNFNACHAGAVQSHVLPTRDRRVGITGFGIIAPTTVLGLGGNDQLNRLFSRFTKGRILSQSVRLAKSDGGDAMTVHSSLPSQVPVLLLLRDEPFEGLFNIALKFPGFVMTNPPPVVAKECQTSACGIEISSASVLFGIPAAVWFLMARKPFESQANGSLGGIRSTKLLDDLK